MQYGPMHQLPAKSLHHLHQLTAPAASLQHQTYQHAVVQKFPHLHPHAQPTVAAHKNQPEVHQYPAHAQEHVQASQALDQSIAANHGQQHVQQQQGHAQHYPAAQQYPTAPVPAQQEPGKQAAAEDESPEGSIELGDDWIEKVGLAAC